MFICKYRFIRWAAAGPSPAAGHGAAPHRAPHRAPRRTAPHRADQALATEPWWTQRART